MSVQNFDFGRYILRYVVGSLVLKTNVYLISDNNINRGSYMSADVLLNFFKQVEKK